LIGDGFLSLIVVSDERNLSSDEFFGNCRELAVRGRSARAVVWWLPLEKNALIRRGEMEATGSCRRWSNSGGHPVSVATRLAGEIRREGQDMAIHTHLFF
jgi:hypothetical protein